MYIEQATLYERLYITKREKMFPFPYGSTIIKFIFSLSLSRSVFLSTLDSLISYYNMDIR